MRTGTLSSFRSRFRSAGALIVDDVHFLAAKRATQDEFLHTFNALVDKGAPIVLAADQHPRLITRLTDELVTRFLGGMVVKIEAPDLATRRAILQAKAVGAGGRRPRGGHRLHRRAPPRQRPRAGRGAAHRDRPGGADRQAARPEPRQGRAAGHDPPHGAGRGPARRRAGRLPALPGHAPRRSSPTAAPAPWPTPA